MKILSIETSCDETAIALVEVSGNIKNPRFRLLKNVVSSQIETHRPWGGVVPNLAKREHLKNLPIIFNKLKNITKLGLIAVTVGPGLEPCLWTGITFVKEIYKQFRIKNSKLKLIGVNHLEGHLYSFLLSKSYSNVLKNIRIIKPRKIFPAIALIVSGGHTILLLVKSLTKWKKLGETRDDAVGEAFDKVARLLRLPYPGGPELERLAKKGNPKAIEFPRPMINTKDYDFSFSGIKTSVLYYLRDSAHSNVLKNIRMSTNKSEHKRGGVEGEEGEGADVAASFQKAAIDVLISKTLRAAKNFRAKSIMLSGGVAANKALRKELRVISSKLKVNFFVPPKKFNTDNAVMIAVAAYINYLRRKNRAIRAQGNLNM